MSLTKTYRVNVECMGKWHRSRLRWFEARGKADGQYLIFDTYHPHLFRAEDCLETIEVESLDAADEPQTAAAPVGFGDTVEKWIKTAQLDKLAKLYEKLSGQPCNCAGRKALLNKLLPYRPQIAAESHG